MFRDFMRGRYGIDAISIIAMLLALLLTRFNYVWILGSALLGYAIFRIMSKAVDKRYREKQKFDNLIKPLAIKLNNFSSRLQQRKTHTIVRCKKCKKSLRLPKNKGKIKVSCPVCGLEFIMKT